MLRWASQPPSTSTPVSQRILPMSEAAMVFSAGLPPRTSTRVKRSSTSCSQYQSVEKLSAIGDAVWPARRRADFFVAAFFLLAFKALLLAGNLTEAYRRVQSN